MWIYTDVDIQYIILGIHKCGYTLFYIYTIVDIYKCRYTHGADNALHAFQPIRFA